MLKKLYSLLTFFAAFFVSVNTFVAFAQGPRNTEAADAVNLEGGIDYFDASFDVVLDYANISTNPIAIYIYRNDKQCQLTAREVLSDPDIKAVLTSENIIFHPVNMYSTDNKIGFTMMEKLGSSVYPTFAILNSNGEPLDKRAILKGEFTKTDLLELCEQSLSIFKSTNDDNQERKGYNDLFDTETQYDLGNRDPDLLMAYARNLKTFNYGYTTDLIVDEYFASTKKQFLVNNHDHINFVFDFATNTDSEAFKQLIENKQLFIDLYTRATVDAKLRDAIENKIVTATAQSDEETFNKHIKLIEKCHLANEREFTASMNSEFYSYTGNWVGYANAMFNYVQQNRITKPAKLMDIAYNVGINLKYTQSPDIFDGILEWTKNVVKLNPDVADYKITYGILLYKKYKSPKKAIKILTQAKKIAMAKRSYKEEEYCKRLITAMQGKSVLPQKQQVETKNK
ncbi:MAG: hypothetical protein IPI59_00035 [Sphingobacteriales bacterium]|jgi:hypothetical protein|nr:hypothetical protein [Sphingobacteriales bacterium]MBP9142780.1 hypothetical protein [Chitinophagales bacterium]MDA0197770.1 hypothetical protein [Bacteroidota bacterium]MBK7525968.1 hypothetical protein [Sphingobacteriales bacterium]MBK8677683.1 hypothetical protein [Sphingobacteriales bacterium]